MKSASEVTANASEFVKLLSTEGKRVPCDETAEKFKKCTTPDFYDEEKFKRGQQFFHKHIFAMFIAKFSGLVSILAIPSIRNVLMYTKMSSDPLTSYRRYLSTVFHMYVWYKDEFKPGTDLWNSILEVRTKHNSASKRHCKAGHASISQYDMAITQFGFMGYVLSRPEMVGIHSYTENEMEDFVHVWRVIGDIMGIEERFNICRESVQETKIICDELLNNILRPEIEKMDPDFINMSTHLVNGMWCMQPMLEFNVFLSYIFVMFEKNHQTNNNDAKIQLSKKQSIHLWFISSVISTMRFWILKMYHNTVMYLSLWLMVNFPFLAYYKFGKGNSHVYILQNRT